MSQVWFITGAGRGLGAQFARAALGRGDRVAATARDVAALDDLRATHGDAVLPIQLDVTERTSVTAAVATAVDAFGRLDVVVNNAGYGLLGAVEEISEQQLRDQFDVNFFGVVSVTQAVLPVLREQGSGRIIQISTMGGVIAVPYLGGYHASKWALEGLTESLAHEVAAFGIAVTLVEPGGYSTDFAGSSAVYGMPQPQYDGLRQGMAAQSEGQALTMQDPAAVGPAMLALVDAEHPPLRVFFGAAPTAIVPAVYQQRLETWEQWNWLSMQANGVTG